MRRSTVARVEHLCCGMEAQLIRELLTPVEHVGEVKISLLDRRVNVEHGPEISSEEIIELLNGQHLGASLQDESAVEEVGSSFTQAEMVRLSVNAMQLTFFVTTITLSTLHYSKVAHGMAWACVSLSFALFEEAWRAVRRRSPNVEMMMALALAGALLLGEIEEAATVGSLVTLMDLVKMFALEAVGRKLRGSVVNAPQTVGVPGGGKVLLSELNVGDLYLLRVGDVVPADGTVVVGSATFDESRVTGEATPQAKSSGEQVVSGGIVSNGYVHVRTDKPVSASFQARKQCF